MEVLKFSHGFLRGAHPLESVRRAADLQLVTDGNGAVGEGRAEIGEGLGDGRP